MKHNPDPSTYTRKLDPAVKAKWLEELRFGGWRQIREFAYRDGTDGRCALGIALGIVGGRVSHHLDEYGISKQARARINDMNEREGKSFSEIADWIEEHL
jgi:hypothetical protein